MREGNYRRVTLTQKQEAWLVRHFKHTKNADIMEKLGISDGTLHRIARAMGLKKSPQFMHKCQKEMTDAAKRSHILNGTYPPKGYRIPRSEEFQFRKGEKSVDRIGKRKERKRLEKAHASWKETWKLEHARAVFGLPRRTKLRVVARPKHYASQRYYLKRRGYVFERGGMTAYYTTETRRSERFEARTRDNCRKYVPFEFKPIGERS